MPATPLYTVITHTNGMVIFHLDPDAYAQALQEENAENEKQKDLYKLFLDVDLPKEGLTPEAGREHAIYLGEDICTVYEPGKPPRVVAFPSLLKLMGNNPESRLKDPAFKEYILAQVIGSKNLTIQRHIQAYREANPSKPSVELKRMYDASMILEATNLNKDIFIRYSDGQYRDEKFRVVSKDAVEPSPELYKYTATQENDQITLRLDAPVDNAVTRTALEKLKRFAPHLLPLAKDPKNARQWPKIEVQGEGAKTLFQDNARLNYYNRRNEREFIIKGGMIATAILIGTVFLLIFSVMLTPLPVLIVGGILAGALGASLGYALRQKHKKDKAYEYNLTDPLGHELVFISELREKTLEKALIGKIYLDTDGGYILRNTALNSGYGKVKSDKIPHETWVKLLDGKSLKSQLNNPDFKKAILEITTLKGYTAANAYDKELAAQYGAYFAHKAMSNPSALTTVSPPITAATTIPSTVPAFNTMLKDSASKHSKPKP